MVLLDYARLRGREKKVAFHTLKSLLIGSQVSYCKKTSGVECLTGRLRQTDLLFSDK